MRYNISSTENIRTRMRAFNEYYALLRDFIDKGILKSSLDRGAYTHPKQILNKDIIDSLGPKRHRISLGYGPEVGEEIIREKIVQLENLRWQTKYTPDNVVMVAGAWFGVEITIEEIIQRNKRGSEVKIATIGPTHYQLFQRPIEVLGAKIIGFDFTNFQGSTPKTKREIDEILKFKPDIIFITNPNNPNGEYFPANILNYLIDRTKRNNIFLIIDEMQNFLPVIGKNLNYGPWVQAKHVIRINSFSKHYGLAEYRTGWIIAGKEFIGSRYEGVIQHVRGLMGNAPRAANDAISNLLDIEIGVMKNNPNPMQKKLNSLLQKEKFIIKHLSKNPKIKIINRNACFNITVKVDGFPSDMDLAKRLMEAGTLIMPCAGYGYKSSDVVMRITFAERWGKIRHSINALTSVLENQK
ncbi:MAG: aminotransferase class I/II-fold pyridoxal phosphate-dependent enzyme [Caldithrix sp.]|nr:aminotransferase class I/II-fold pyridoxal phosphate-dependent enzyme [Caldithrix sp.]